MKGIKYFMQRKSPHRISIFRKEAFLGPTSYLANEIWPNLNTVILNIAGILEWMFHCLPMFFSPFKTEIKSNEIVYIEWNHDPNTVWYKN